jgi:nucleoside-diphosphate-sugar epimerase
MARFLVTGAAGFIGCSLVRELLQQGHEVRGFDNLSTGKRENVADIKGHFDFIVADLLDVDAVRRACAGVEYILHQAALASVPRSVENPVASNESNVTGTLNLLIAARDAGVRRVVYASSSSVYGESETLPKHEDMMPDPISPYAVTKLTGEMYLKCFYRVYGLETVALRYFNVFGPRQDANSQYSGVLARFITQMLKGDQPTIFGDGTQSRDFNYVDNTVQANLKAALAPADAVAGGVFNVATGSRVTLNETYATLQKLIGYAEPPLYGPERKGDIKHSLADISLARKTFGYDPKIGFEEGMRRTVDWYRNSMASRAGLAGR